MPAPNATGTQGNSRPAPASARAQLVSFATRAVQTSKPAGANPPACAAPRGGHVPAISRTLPPPRSAMQRHFRDYCETMLPDVGRRQLGEQTENTEQSSGTIRVPCRKRDEAIRKLTCSSFLLRWGGFPRRFVMTRNFSRTVLAVCMSTVHFLSPGIEIG